MFEKLRRLRVERNVSVKTLSDILGLETEAAYYKKETGAIKISLVEGKKIADFFGLPIEENFFPNELSK